MVKTLALVLLAVPALAAAEPVDYARPPPDQQPEAPSHNKLGFRIGFGRLHVLDRTLSTSALGLEIEHPVFTHTRVFAEYEWVNFGDKDAMTPATKGLPGTGHRTSVGLRGEIMGGTLEHAMHFYIDAELGGGVGVLSDDISGVAVIPHVFAGLRAGYDFLWGAKLKHSSHVFEAALTARAIRMPEGGTGAMFSIGMLWGD